MYRTVLWTLWERERVGRFGRMAMKHVKYPGLMPDTGCLGLVHWDDQMDGMGREEGGWFRMRNTCIPVVDSC